MLQISIFMYFNINFVVFVVRSPMSKTLMDPSTFPLIWGVLLHMLFLGFLALVSSCPKNLRKHYEVYY